MNPLRLLPGLALLALAACSAGTSGPAAPSSPVTSATATPAADARTLRDVYLANGPADFTLPRTASIYTRIDQPNVVTLTFDVAARSTLSGWFAHRLPTGWSIDANAHDSLLFHGPGWQGAFTCSSRSCALTLRHQS